MPDLFRVTERALEIIEERFTRWYEDLLQQEETSLTEAVPQRRRRRAYEDVAALPLEEYGAAREAFGQQFGPGEFHRQVGLGLRRQAKEGDNA